jgi:transcription elongation GreA/GreB family factor
MDKRALLDAIVAALAAELETLTAAARDARAYATDEQSRAEDKHDTRAIEASYLADGQGRVALEVQEALTAFRALELRAFGEGEPIAMAALVELEVGRQRELYFLGPRSGGLEVKFEGREVFVITPQSPIGRKLLGKRVGDAVAFEGPRAGRPARIVAVA